MVSSDGKVALSGESVIFIINGKTITAKTDKNGIYKDIRMQVLTYMLKS
ncbi:MAG: hypothetical protein VZR10_06030 [Methanobrevibacter sp.]|nr:hypothetical protein [Methanobrevibacter sp.]